MVKFLFALYTLIGIPFSAFASTPEKILGVSTNTEGISFQVFSSGCTDKDDFELLQLETHPLQIKLDRKTQDLCEAFLPYGVILKYTWAELGLQNGTQFYISNKLSGPQTVHLSE